ncbi:hypothetical protein DPU24_20280 [Salmonella enterica subsp. enterica serovar Oranienburg]|nr:hypothetical protein [Salmonella enterica subsp. enterica serovar Oranienburg]EDU7784834.1 hypothetical protein [Salmonella enterica subsp. enterica serovar Oranienburg]HAK8202660.1 hypothetical protein [Salmonella enterica]
MLLSRASDCPRVVVYGDDWTLASGVSGLVAARWLNVSVEFVPGFVNLVQTLQEDPSAGLLLCLRAHEHIPVLDALRPLIPGRGVRVVSSTVWYSDRVVLHALGYRPAERPEDLLDTQNKAFRHGLENKCFLDGFMNELVRQGGRDQPEQVCAGEMSRRRTAALLWDIRRTAVMMLPAELPEGQWLVLCYFAQGLRGKEVAMITGLQEKTVSLYRRRALAALGMEEVRGGLPLYRGVLVREVLRCYPAVVYLNEAVYG